MKMNLKLIAKSFKFILFFSLLGVGEKGFGQAEFMNIEDAQIAEATSATKSLAQAISQLSASIPVSQAKAKAAAGSGQPEIAAIETDASVAAKALVAEVESCQSAGSYAKFCLAGFSPGIQTALGAVGLLMNAASSMKSMADSCSNLNKGMKIAKDALTAFNIGCSAAQYNCSESCGSLVAHVEAASAKFKGHPEFINTPALIAPQVKLCQSYKLNAMAAATGAFAMLQKSMQMKQCAAATTVVDCTKDPLNASCPQVLDCTAVKNASNATCICKSNPNAAGCPGAVGSNSVVPNLNNKPSTADGSGNKNLTNEKYSATAPDGLISPSGGSPSHPTGGSSLSAGGASGGGGGGGGLGGSGGGSAKEAQALKKSALNGNILGGFEGGGGGGSGGGRSGSSSSGSAGLQAYLPGGAKDPTRSLASKTFGNGEVTSAGSKSNWEKVKDRYQDNKSTLMGP